MPEIFSNLGKIKIIEYGKHSPSQTNWHDMRDNLISYFKKIFS